MMRKLTAAALLAAPALFWASPAQAGVCKNNWGDVTPGGQSSESPCKAIGGRWENADKVEEPATGRVRFSHEVREPESGRVRFSAPPQEGGSTAPAARAVEKLPPDEERVAKLRSASPAPRNPMRRQPAKSVLNSEISAPRGIVTHVDTAQVSRRGRR